MTDGLGKIKIFSKSNENMCTMLRIKFCASNFGILFQFKLTGEIEMPHHSLKFQDPGPLYFFKWGPQLQLLGSGFLILLLVAPEKIQKNGSQKKQVPGEIKSSDQKNVLMASNQKIKIFKDFMFFGPPKMVFPNFAFLHFYTIYKRGNVI